MGTLILNDISGYDDEIQELKAALRKTKNVRMHKRYAVLLRHFEGFTNKKYNYIGHLFQDRYFSELIKRDEQMVETSRYVHLNPVRANMVEKAGEYIWSSYNIIIGKKKEK